MSKTYNSDKLGPVTIPEPDKPAKGHTPGPWEVRLSSGSDGRFISIIGETWPLAHVYTNEIVECEANARLIASAPIGYELANEIMKWANSCPKYIVELAGKFLQQAEGK